MREGGAIRHRRAATTSHAGPAHQQVAMVHRVSSQPRFEQAFSPPRRMVVRETVRAIPINLRLMSPNTVSLNPSYGPVAAQRHSLPTKR